MAKTEEQFGNSIFTDAYLPHLTDTIDIETRRQRCAEVADRLFDALTALDRYTSGQDVNEAEGAAATSVRDSVLHLLPDYEERGASQEVMDGMARLVVDLSLEGQVEPGASPDVDGESPLFWSSRAVGIIFNRASYELSKTYPKQNPCVHY